MTTILPLGDRILVRRDEEKETVSKGGIYIPDNAKERPQTGEVIAVGIGVKAYISIHSGAKVIFGKYAGVEVKLEGGDHLIIKEEDLLGVVVE